MSASKQPDFKIGEWWVRPQRNELEKSGEVVHVEARSMAVLVCLAFHAPEVVTREWLLEEVWRDAFVSDEVISHAIWELRKALGDSARDPAYIKTVPRRGYRLLPEVLRPSATSLPLEGARIDRYEIIEELGRGSMGVVYKAIDQRLGRPVAIKFLAPDLTRDVEACQRFLREARFAASLEHPNLATVYEVSETSQGQRYLVIALYSGGTLKERLIQGPVPIEQAVHWIKQLGAGLSAAHQRGIIHRDINPANLLFDEHHTLKIADFGIAKLLGDTDLTSTKITPGAAAYKSPEQSCGGAVDQRTDVWSMGVVLFELLTGCPPFDGKHKHFAIHSNLSNDPEAEENIDRGAIPEALCQIVAKAMAKNPSERYQSASEMVEALEAMNGPDEIPDRLNLFWRTEWWRIRYPSVALLAFAVVILSVLMVWLSAGRSDSQVWFLVRGVQVEEGLGETPVKVSIRVNGRDYHYPSLGGAEWMEVGPGMSPFRFKIPSAGGYEVRFEMAVKAGRGERRYISQETDVVNDLPYEGQYDLHELAQGVRGLPASAIVSYRLQQQ